MREETAGKESDSGDEFGRIARHFRPLAAGVPGALGLTDDAAVLAPTPGWDLVVTTDAMVAGVHFLPADPPEDVAAKLLRVNLSDLAAMGAEPRWYTLTTALSAAEDETWLAAFARGLAEDQAQFGIGLAGGDSVSIRGPVTLSITAIGEVPAGQALTRRAPRHDDLLFVTGTPGDAALGLMLVLGTQTLELSEADRAYLIERLRRPTPRLTLAPHLRGVASAAADISDGLVSDLGHITRVTGCAAVIEAGRLLLSPVARRVIEARPDLWPELLTGGDDYELVLAAPAAQAETLKALAECGGCAITEIGRLCPVAPGDRPGAVTVIGLDGQTLTLTRRGWNHFPPSP